MQRGKTRWHQEAESVPDTPVADEESNRLSNKDFAALVTAVTRATRPYPERRASLSSDGLGRFRRAAFAPERVHADANDENANPDPGVSGKSNDRRQRDGPHGKHEQHSRNRMP